MSSKGVLEISRDKEVVVVPQSIVDVSSGRLLTNRVIVVKDGIISRLAMKDEVNGLVKQGNVEIVDLGQLILLPGLIDCHVHLALDGIDTPQAISSWEDENFMLDHLTNALANTLHHGIVAVRDGGDKLSVSLRLQNKISDVPTPFVQASGFAIRKEGYYGSFLGEGRGDLNGFKAQVKELKEIGAKQIKVLVSGIVSFSEYAKVGRNQFTLEELQSIVALSHQYGLKVMAHASSDEAVQLAVNAGVDSVEHGYFVSESSLKLMAERQIAWIPTVVPVYIQTKAPLNNLHTPEQIKVITKTYELQLQQIAKAASLGVLMGIGTDGGATGVHHGSSYFTELQMFKRAGLDNLSILRAATINAAKIVGLHGNLGEIKPGMAPCFVAVHENPLENLESLRRIELVTTGKKKSYWRKAQ